MLQMQKENAYLRAELARQNEETLAQVQEMQTRLHEQNEQHARDMRKQ